MSDATGSSMVQGGNTALGGSCLLLTARATVFRSLYQSR
jgi:hypothetical protein